MKRALSIVLISTILLAGCSTVKETDATSETVTEVVTEATESETEITETTVEITEPEETEYVRTPESIDAAWEARLEYDDSMFEVPNVTYDGNKVTITNNEELQSALERDLDFNVVDAFSLYRCDRRVITMRVVDWECLDNRILNNYTLSGDILTLDDVISDMVLLKEYALDEYGKEIIEDSLWGFDANGIRFNEGTFDEFHITYYEIADLIYPEYLPGAGEMWGELEYGDINYGDNHLYILQDSRVTVLDNSYIFLNGIDLDSAIDMPWGMCSCEFVCTDDGEYYIWAISIDDTYDNYSIRICDITDGEFEVIYENDVCYFNGTPRDLRTDDYYDGTTIFSMQEVKSALET